MNRMKSAASGRVLTALKFKNAADSKLLQNIDSAWISGSTTNVPPEETR